MSAAGWTAEGRPLLAGAARGSALVLDEPLSFWGGVDAASGAIIDRHHPQAGARLTGVVLVMPAGRGSSSSSSVLAESLHARTGPAAILLSKPDEILLLGALVVRELYDTVCPIVVLAAGTYGRLRTGDDVDVRPDGSIAVRGG